MGLDSKAFRKKEGDQISKSKEGSKEIGDRLKARNKKIDDIKDNAMKSSYMNLYELKRNITTLRDNSNNAHKDIKDYTKKLARYLEDIYDYKMRYLKQPENSHQLKQELLTYTNPKTGRQESKGIILTDQSRRTSQVRDMEPEDFNPKYYTDTVVTRGEALYAFDKAKAYLHQLEICNMKSPLLAGALERVKPFFSQIQKQIDEVISPKLPEREVGEIGGTSSTIVESPKPISESMTTEPMIAESTTTTGDRKSTYEGEPNLEAAKSALAKVRREVYMNAALATGSLYENKRKVANADKDELLCRNNLHEGITVLKNFIAFNHKKEDFEIKEAMNKVLDNYKKVGTKNEYIRKVHDNIETSSTLQAFLKN